MHKHGSEIGLGAFVKLGWHDYCQRVGTYAHHSAAMATPNMYLADLKCDGAMTIPYLLHTPLILQNRRPSFG